MKKTPASKRAAVLAKKYLAPAAESGVAEGDTSRQRQSTHLNLRTQVGPPRSAAGGQTIRPGHSVPRELSPEGTSAFHREALGLFIAIADQWALTVPQRLAILGKPPTSASTYHHWKHAVMDHRPIQDNPDLIDRIAYIVGIFEGAGRFWGTPERAVAWLIEPNKAVLFAGQPPLARILGGRMEDLRQTCAYIEGAAEGAW